MSESAEQKAFQDGSLVVVSIGKKSWATQLTPQDMGLKEFPANWKAGRRLILPNDALKNIDTIEGQARRYLDSRSFNFGKAQTRVKYRFVHLAKLFDTIHTLENYREQFFGAVKALKGDYEKLKEQMALDYPDQWPALEKLYPNVDDIDRHYYFLIETVQMTFPTGFSAMKNYELKRMEEILHEAEVGKAANLEDLRRQTEEHRRNLERMEKEQRDEAQGRVEQFVEEAVKSLRSKVVETFQQITAKIQDKKAVIKTNVDSLREVIAHVRDMDFLNDTAFHRQLDDVRQLLDTTTEFKDNNAATEALNAALSSTIKFVNDTTEKAAADARKTYFGRKLAI